MKKMVKNIGLVLLTSLLWTSCSKDEDNGGLTPVDSGNAVVKAEDFKNLKNKALADLTEKFSMNTSEGIKTFTSKNGVKITVNPADIVDANGNPLTGDLEFEYIEIFKSGSMVTTDMHTMGVMQDGNMSILQSGGEIKFQCKSKTSEAEGNLKSGATIPVQIPTALSGEAQFDMLVWDFNLQEEGEAAGKNGWNVIVAKVDEGQNGEPQRARVDGKGEQSSYYIQLTGFGWTNVDRFYNDPRPKTEILVGPPATYDGTNSAVYLHYRGEGNALAKLDTFDTATNLFSEHYGQIPVGLECDIIFVTENSGQWRYAIKPVTISANATYNIAFSETTVGSKAQLEAAVNALP
jgi:hypothetical protein